MGKKTIISSFAGNNSGTIMECCAKIVNKKKGFRSVFCSLNRGRIDQSYDTEEPFERKGKQYVLTEEPKYITIERKEQVIDLARKINSGDREIQNSNFKLMNDIDLAGEKIEPIGNSIEHAFTGSWNGNGFKIHNFQIVNKTAEFTGFFGYLKNAKVFDFTIEGTVRGGKNVGAFAGKSENSEIRNCTANTKLSGKESIAGFVAENQGTIENCYASSSIKQTPIVPIVSGTVALAACGGVLAFMLLRGNSDTPDYYPPIPVDAEAVFYDRTEPEEGNNKIDCHFSSTVTAGSGGKEAKLNFRNPGKSNQHMLVQLQITDAELKKVNGSTGRTKEEMKKLKESKNYNPDAMRVVVGESGTVPPGYKLEHIKLNKLPDGTSLKKGTYNAIIFLSFYDIKTNSKAMINTQTPVKFVVA